MTRSLRARLARAMVVSAIVAAVASCVQPAIVPPPTVSIHDRIAREIAEASPAADPSDAKARDAASERLGRLGDLLAAAGERILWGGFDPQKGYDPGAQRLTEFSPVVWARLYLSAFTFDGTHEIRKEGPFTIVEIGARFRDGLDAGDYPYPFWHSATKWQAYLETRSLMLIFEGERLIAAYRKASHDAGRPPATRKWDGRWMWTDAQGGQQPRVALYSYLLSADNPSVESLDRAYRDLEAAFRRNNCFKCHAPDNAARASPLLLLDFPNQALAARRSLVETLRKNAMPPADVAAGVGAGVGDHEEQKALLSLAERFEREADAALAFERARAVKKDGAGR